MRSLSTLLLVLVAGCAANQRMTVVGGSSPSESDWPYDRPAWALVAEEARTPDENMPNMMVACLLYDAGSSADRLAAASGLADAGPVVLSEAAATTLLERLGDDSQVTEVTLPRLVVHSDRPAWTGIESRSRGGHRWYMLSDLSAEDGTVTLHYEISSATRRRNGDWDMNQSWKMCGVESLKPGQAILHRGGLNGADGDMLALLRIEAVKIKPKPSQNSGR